MQVTQENSLQVFLGYINYEKKQTQRLGNGLVIALYERAIETHCFDPYIWTSYVGFMSHSQSNAQMAALCHRALKNSFHCLTNGSLWEYRLRYLYLEGLEEDLQRYYKHAVYFVSSAQNDRELVKVIMCRLFIERKKFLDGKISTETLTEVLCEASEHLDKISDEECTIQRYMAYIEATDLKSYEQADERYSSLVQSYPSWQLWTDWAQMAILHGKIDRARQIYTDAIRKPIEGMERLYRARLDFEYRYGNVGDLHESMDRIFFAREKDAMNQKPNPPEEQHVESSKRNREDDGETERKKIKTEEDSQSKLRQVMGDIKSYKVIDKTNAGQMIFLGDLPFSATVDQLLGTYKRYGRITDCYIEPNEEGILEGYLEFQTTDSVRRAVLAGEVTMGETVIKPVRCRPRIMKWGFRNEERRDTVYVSNLSPTCDKMMIRQLFGQIGKVHDIRLQFKPNYAFAYVQFFNEETASEACTLDQTVLDGKTIGVNISNPAKKTVHEVDETELYVSNLAPSIVEADLEELFGKFGSIKEIRLIHQGFKSFAYVQYHQRVMMINLGRRKGCSVSECNSSGQSCHFGNHC
jgi:tetratricopeptide (TPR) repeat protein